VDSDDYARQVAYLEKVREVVRRAAFYIGMAQLKDAKSLVDHGEPAEGLNHAAWALSVLGVGVPADLIDSLLALVADSDSEEFLPEDLRQLALPPEEELSVVDEPGLSAWEQ
jgi:hypothetical protein